MLEIFKKYLSNQSSPEEMNLLLNQFDIEENRDVLRNLIAQQLEADQGLVSIDQKEEIFFLAEAYQNIRSRIFSSQPSNDLI